MEKKNNGIVIILMGVIIVILAVLCILFATNTITFNHKEQDTYKKPHPLFGEKLYQIHQP